MGKVTKKKEAVAPKIPRRIFAHVSPRSVGGVSMFDAAGNITAGTVGSFRSDARVIDEAVNRLRSDGFEILQVTSLTINIAGTHQAYERAFHTKLTIEQRSVIKPGARDSVADFVECPDTSLPGLIRTTGTRYEDVVEGVAIEEPRYFMAASPYPPTVGYWHLDVPSDVSLGLYADKVHRSGITGSSIRVAMVDTGHFTHPFFTQRGYRVAPVVLGPAATKAAKDEVGHGTGESANIFSVAPDAELLPVKMSFVNSLGAFNAAVALNPDIITCSWGSSNRNGPLSAADQALAAAVASAWAAGIVVVFSAGNGHWGFPAQHPDCIAAGGVFMSADGALRASDYASGFVSNIYPGRRVPDCCGLVGMRPKAIYIMLPVEPGDEIDAVAWNDPSGSGLQGGTYPQGDETGRNDGWGCFSGTSAAAPQLAGLAALIRQACPRLSPAEVRDIMRRTARDVTAGSCSPSTGGNPATQGPDTATGDGLVDAQKAVLVAKVRCMTVASGPVRGLPPRQPSPIQPRPEPPQAGPVLPQPSPTPPRPELGPVQPETPSGARWLDEVSLEAQVTGERQPVPLSQADCDAIEDLITKSTENPL